MALEIRMFLYEKLKNILKKPKIKMVVIGNCQSRPLAAIFNALNPNIEIISIAVVHLLQTHQYEEYRSSFEQADFIIAQSVSDSYSCEFVRTYFLEARYRKKLISILNLYYTGYTPDWVYIRTKNKQPLKGPMGDYHNQTIFDGWKTGLAIEETVRRLEDPTYNQIYANAGTESLQELQKREKAVDVKIVDYIVQELQKERLFFTINHPSHKLLEEYAKRILHHCKIPIKNNHVAFKDEPLGQFKPRVNPIVIMDEINEPHHYGIEFSIAAPMQAGIRKKNYTSTEIASLFYQLYENNKEQL